MIEKVVIVSGGGNGIGLEIAKLFASHNNKVYVLDIDDTNKDILKSLNIKYCSCDISYYKNVQNVFGKIFNKEKQVDILVNCASKQIISEFKDYNEEEYTKIMKTNYIGTCNCIHNAIQNMHEGSTILNIISVHSNKPRKNKIAYDCSKSAIEMLTKELGLELASKKITVNGLSFGAVNTKMNDEWTTNPYLKKCALEKVPLNIIFEPIQIANFCYNIIEEFSKYTTGTIFVIDGGRSLN